MGKQPRDRLNKGGWGHWILCMWKTPSGWSDSSTLTASHVWWWCQLTLANDMHKHGGIVLWHGRLYITENGVFLLFFFSLSLLKNNMLLKSYTESQGALSMNTIKGEMELWSSAALLCLSVSVAVLRRRCSALNLSSGVRWSHGWEEIKTRSVKIQIQTNKENFTNVSHKERGGEEGIGKHPISLLIMPLCNGSFLSHICNRVFARYKHFQIIIPPCYSIGNISVYWLYHMFISVTLYLCSLISYRSCVYYFWVGTKIWH